MEIHTKRAKTLLLLVEATASEIREELHVVDAMLGLTNDDALSLATEARDTLHLILRDTDLGANADRAARVLAKLEAIVGPAGDILGAQHDTAGAI